MFAPIIALGAGVALLYFLSKKKRGQLVYPRAGQTWTIALNTSRPLTTADYKTWFAQIAPMADVMGVQGGGATDFGPVYYATLHFTTDSYPFRIGDVSTLLGARYIVLSATRAPIA